MKNLLSLIAFILISASGFSQPVKANVKDLGFMAGKWTLKHEWGDMEEYWGAPMGDNMICSFRCVKDGKAVFYEFIVIEQTNGTPVMKMRHFNPGNIGWEEKDKPYNLNLISLSKSKAAFESVDKKVKLYYERTSPTKLVSWLEEKNKKGELEKEYFNYTLKP